MQRYANPDVFFCPLYNAPGVSNPKMHICDDYVEQDLLASPEWIPLDDPTTETSSPSDSSAAASRTRWLSPRSASKGSDPDRKAYELNKMAEKERKKAVLESAAGDKGKGKEIIEWLATESECAERQE